MKYEQCDRVIKAASSDAVNEESELDNSSYSSAGTELIRHLTTHIITAEEA